MTKDKMTKSCEDHQKSKMTKMTLTKMTTIQKIRLTPYGASLIELDFPVTFHQNCLSPLLSIITTDRQSVPAKWRANVF